MNNENQNQLKSAFKKSDHLRERINTDSLHSEVKSKKDKKEVKLNIIEAIETGEDLSFTKKQEGGRKRPKTTYNKGSKKVTIDEFEILNANKNENSIENSQDKIVSEKKGYKKQGSYRDDGKMMTKIQGYIEENQNKNQDEKIIDKDKTKPVKKLTMYESFFKYKYAESKIKKIYSKPKTAKKTEGTSIAIKGIKT